jgi:hypothetical protein
MDPNDLTIRILQEIRDGQTAFRSDVNARFEQVDKRFEQMDKRFEVVETTLRDLAGQMDEPDKPSH